MAPIVIEIRAEDPDSPAARWCLAQYYAELDRRFDGGFNPDTKAYAGNAEARPPDGLFILAWSEQDAVGCGALLRLDPECAEIKRMWVAPAVRGQGLARRLLERLEQAALAAGYAAVRLDTNKALAEAQALYRKAGYSEIARYSANPYAHHWFEKRLTTA